jgi:hypothetical protein
MRPVYVEISWVQFWNESLLIFSCDFPESHFKHQGLVTGYQTGNDGEQQLQP